MIGIVLVTHGEIGKMMVAAVKKILPDCHNIRDVSIDSDTQLVKSSEAIRDAIAEVDKGNGIILLSDMFGGTPTNLCLDFLEPGKIEVIAGVNLPMLIKLASIKDKMPFDELAEFLKKYGQKNIVIASNVLKGDITY